MILETVLGEDAAEGGLTRYGRLYTVDFVAQGLEGGVTACPSGSSDLRADRLMKLRRRDAA